MLRRPETGKGLNSGLTSLARRDKTRKNAMPLSPQPRVAGSIPVPLAPFFLEFKPASRRAIVLPICLHNTMTAVLTAVDDELEQRWG